jgi:hypothetical protein
MVLTKRQRNEIFDTLRDGGVDPAVCQLVTDQGNARLTYLPSLSTFDFVKDEGWFSFKWNVVDGRREDLSDAGVGWSDLLEELKYWAEEVRYVNDTPDLWEELKRAPQILAAVEAADSNAHFPHALWP